MAIFFLYLVDPWQLNLTFYIIQILNRVFMIIHIVALCILSWTMFVNAKFNVVSSHYWSIWELKYFAVPVMNPRDLTNLLFWTWFLFTPYLLFITTGFMWLVLFFISDSSVKIRFLHSGLRDLFTLVSMTSRRWIVVCGLLFLRLQWFVFWDFHWWAWIIN